MAATGTTLFGQMTHVIYPLWKWTNTTHTSEGLSSSERKRKISLKVQIIVAWGLTGLTRPCSTRPTPWPNIYCNIAIDLWHGNGFTNSVSTTLHKWSFRFYWRNNIEVKNYFQNGREAPHGASLFQFAPEEGDTSMSFIVHQTAHVMKCMSYLLAFIVDK